jgi:hypothetical protein
MQAINISTESLPPPLIGPYGTSLWKEYCRDLYHRFIFSDSKTFAAACFHISSHNTWSSSLEVQVLSVLSAPAAISGTSGCMQLARYAPIHYTWARNCLNVDLGKRQFGIFRTKEKLCIITFSEWIFFVKALWNIRRP